jgi:hypothetical protein
MQHDACRTPPRCAPVPLFSNEALQPGKCTPGSTPERKFKMSGTTSLEDAGGKSSRLRVDLQDWKEYGVLDVAVKQKRFFR